MISLQLLFVFIVNFVNIQQIQSRELIDSKEPKIIGGLPASIEDEKHFVSIRMIAREETEGFGAGHRCGGTLINEKIVITAAHCLFTTRFGQLIPISEKDLSVALGTTYLKLRDENTVVRSVIKIIRHAQYNDSITTNDIGLLLLNDTAIVNGNPNTGVMKLTNKSPEVGEECRISGFGHQTWVRT
uniref:CSON007621 protein n=1 Tax=Culicoides sonorensis TaxID=179676 RepID=A0A336MWU4_CULSO